VLPPLKNYKSIVFWIGKRLCNVCRAYHELLPKAIKKKNNEQNLTHYRWMGIYSVRGINVT